MARGVAVTHRAMRLVSLVAQQNENQDDGRDAVVLILDDGNDEHELSFEGYPSLSMHFESDGTLNLNFAVLRRSPAEIQTMYSKAMLNPPGDG